MIDAYIFWCLLISSSSYVVYGRNDFVAGSKSDNGNVGIGLLIEQIMITSISINRNPLKSHGLLLRNVCMKSHGFMLALIKTTDDYR